MPPEPHDAYLRLVHNEQVKLLATFMNTVGAGAVVAGALAPVAVGFLNHADFVTFSPRTVIHIVVWSVFGGLLHAAARFLLKGLQG